MKDLTGPLSLIIFLFDGRIKTAKDMTGYNIRNGDKILED
jgi:hypothetical protein